MGKNKSLQKLEKYNYLLDIFQKNCKGNCSEKYKKIISYLDDESLRFLAECIRNILSPEYISNLKKSKQKNITKKVLPHKKTIKKVINKKASHKQRKKIFQEGGAWFLPLLSAIIPLVTSIITSSIKK